uniref:DEAD/DEAH box helicase n=1 Tax=Bosea sp. NBC_00436 TaxID=2969620 RepID=A0A9E8CTX3_9HYPH
MSFSLTSPPLARALADRNYSDPTPVQSAVIEDAARGRDLLVSSQTGSGKTIAYGLAIGETLLGTAEKLGPAAEPLALIIAPTRELALQVQRELAWLYAQTGARVISCVGGMDPRREAMLLDEGAHIVVGTPGRLRDHIERRRLDVSALKAVVLDEADEMLDLGFRDDLEFILKTAPESRRSLLFSATFPKAIVQLAQSYQRDALRIEVEATRRGHADIAYKAVRVFPKEAELAVVNLLRFHNAPVALVFCNTRNAVRHLEAILLERGFTSVALSGELGQNERNAALQALRDGRARVCVATDVAARGIDLPGLDLVIHAELPNDSEVMQHRSGRTGRAGNQGTSVLLVPQSRRRKAERLLMEAKVDAEWIGPPTEDEIRVLDQERLLSDPLLNGDGSEDDAGMIEALMSGREARDIAAALVRLYRARLPAAEEVGDPGFGRDERRPVRSNEDYAAKRPFGARRDEGEDGERPRKPAGPRGDTVWFRLDIGRKQGADPRQLLPMLCRRGRITRDEVGAIRIFDRETKVEIDADVADRFYDSVRIPDRDKIVIEPTTEAERRPAKSFADKAERPAAPRRSWGDDQAAGEDRSQRARFEPRDANQRAPRGEDRKPYRTDSRPPRDDARPPRRDDGKPGGGFKKPFAGKGKPFAGKPDGGRPAGGKPFGKGKPRGGPRG